MNHQRLIRSLLFLTLIFSAHRAAADPIPIEGSFHVSDGGIIFGTGRFSAGDVSVLVSASGHIDAACQPCLRGETVSFTADFVEFSNSIFFESEPFTLPRGGRVGSFFTVTMPFSFDARSSANTSEPHPNAGTISGVGTVTGTFVHQRLERQRVIGFLEATYVPTEVTEVAPVPEPASMLLLGTGLAGVGLRRWRQRQRTQTTT